MLKNVLGSALRITAVTWALCGLAYPLAVNGLSQMLFPGQANGSLLSDDDGKPLGSSLIGQDWSGAQWFHGRPSGTTDTDPQDPSKTIAAPYNAASSNGSNLGPTSKALSERLQADRRELEKVQPELAGKPLPADMLTTSASGLDPDISPANALLQAARVAKARGVAQDSLRALIAQNTQEPSLGIFGEPRVNVLELNQTLQKTYPAHGR
ncbi:potassium-transporting ATPase subunit KdpC [Comamonas guangdongensis]|uniref:Potassium-transporting ATPase KdpC subunit n=1 Tax=Comamonas guangdongensis TaxID=510515 RepID=A0ABV3ZQT0_9BURK